MKVRSDGSMAAAAYLAIFCMVVGIAGVIGAAVWIAVTQSR